MQPLTFGLSWVHIFFVILWLGGFFFELIAIFPALPALSSVARGELLQKVIGKALRVEVMINTAALAFGALLLTDMTWGNPSLLTDSSWGVYISLGAVLGLIAYLKFLLLDRPVIKRLLKNISTGPGGTSEDPFSGKPPKAMFAGVITQAALLVAAFTFMVAAAQA